MENIISSFPPIIDKSCRILILGTMPGVESLRKQEYYGHKMNNFWKIIFSLFGEEFTSSYEFKKKLLLKRHVGLWDVLSRCEREGSSDSNIKNPQVNDFGSLFKRYESITDVYFNGKNADRLFGRYVEKNIETGSLSFHTLPSTSPANNTIRFQEKLETWKTILIPLGPKPR